MKPSQSFQRAILALSCVACVVPQSVVSAQEAAHRAAPASQIVDLRLGRDHSLSGQLVTTSGVGVADVTVALRQADRDVALTKTDARGAYRFERVTSGVFDMTAGGRTQKVRVWQESIAPPAAQSAVVFVLQENVVRGQNACDACDSYASGGDFGGLGGAGLLFGAAAVTGIVVGVVALKDVNDLEDDVARLRRRSP